MCDEPIRLSREHFCVFERMYISETFRQTLWEIIRIREQFLKKERRIVFSTICDQSLSCSNYETCISQRNNDVLARAYYAHKGRFERNVISNFKGTLSRAYRIKLVRGKRGFNLWLVYSEKNKNETRGSGMVRRRCI